MRIAYFTVFLLLTISSISSFINLKSTSTSLPIKFTYINRLKSWTNPTVIASSLGVPGYSNHTYTHIALTFWLCDGGPVDTAKLWNDPITYLGPTTVFGFSNQEIRSNLKAMYKKNGVKLLISAFGATEKPTSRGVNPWKCADRLADFVLETGLDGVDVDWEDSRAFMIPSLRG